MLVEAAENQNITLHQLSVISGVPYSTVWGIANSTIRMEDCSYLTIQRLCSALNTTPEYLVQVFGFRHFRDELHNQIKSLGPVNFLIKNLNENSVIQLYRAGYTVRAMYLMCMIDYISRLLCVPILKEYDFLRHKKLEKPLVIAERPQNGNPEYIPEFERHNILEGDIFDAV